MLTRGLLNPMLLVLACAPGSALASCQIDRLELGAPPYSAVESVQGRLRVGVHCDQPTEAFRLSLDAVGARPDFGAKQFNVQLVGPGSTLGAQIQNALPALAGSQGGTLFRGDQTLEFPIFVPQNQWQAVGGQYTVRLGLNLIPAAPGE